MFFKNWPVNINLSGTMDLANKKAVTKGVAFCRSFSSY